MKQNKRSLLSREDQRPERAQKKSRSRRHTLDVQGVTQARNHRRAKRSQIDAGTFFKVLRRRAKLVGVAMLSLALGGAAVVGVGLVRRWALSSSALTLEAVEVSGLSRATREEILAAAGVELGQSLVAIDPSEVERAVEQHPWVASAEARRHWPKRLAIRVREHRPVALVALGSLYHVDSEGTIVKRHTPGDGADLPIITGLSREEVENREGTALSRLRSAISFLQEWRAIGGEKAPAIAEILLEAGTGLSFVPVGDDVRVHLPRPPWREGLARVAEARAALRQRSLIASEISIGGNQRPDRVVARIAGMASPNGSGGDGR